MENYACGFNLSETGIISNSSTNWSTPLNFSLIRSFNRQIYTSPFCYSIQADQQLRKKHVTFGSVCHMLLLIVRGLCLGCMFATRAFKSTICMPCIQFAGHKVSSNINYKVATVKPTTLVSNVGKNSPAPLFNVGVEIRVHRLRSHIQH